MEIALLVLADYANVAQGDKLNIMGIFYNIMAAQFPATHVKMTLVLSLTAEPAEYDRLFDLEIKLINEDATRELVHIEGKGAIPRPTTSSNAAGNRIYINQLFELVNVQFPEPGYYEFSVFINNVLKGTLPLQVAQVAQIAPPAPSA